MNNKRTEKTTPLRVIAVTSGKGGVGKSTVAANLAVIAARQGRRVLLLDGDLGLANAEILLGVAPRFHLGHVLDGSVSIREALTEGPHGIKILSAGTGVLQLARLGSAQKMRIIGELDTLDDDFDLVIADSAAGIGDNMTFFVGACQETILVVSPEPTSLTDAYAAVKVLSQQGMTGVFHVLVNPAASEAQAREVFGRLPRLTERFLHARLRYLGYLPRDENIHRAVMMQRPLVKCFPLSPSSRSLEQIADKLLGEPAASRLEGGLKILWQRLLRESSTPARSSLASE
ncbi:MinD/ParA family protein [Vulgatibacter incomptus]|uniref:MinD/ParA family protein n=1 Tax=Vulgatibacter incomptus TaxID=1391653 RepID=UPI0014704BDE|nr:MinD/ParA family protein [Vulgatibacter incomptus]